MADINMMTGLIVAAILFVLGLAGAVVRRNIIFILLSIEIMLNACGLAFIVAASETALGLGLILNLYHKYKTLDTNQYNQMHG